MNKPHNGIIENWIIEPIPYSDTGVFWIRGNIYQSMNFHEGSLIHTSAIRAIGFKDGVEPLVETKNSYYRLGKPRE